MSYFENDPGYAMNGGTPPQGRSAPPQSPVPSGGSAVRPPKQSKQTLLNAPAVLDMPATYREAMRELARPYPSIKLTDWTGFNAVFGGFRTREYTILCGATGIGKTTFLANLSGQLLKGGVKHGVFSVETGHTDYMKRMISAVVHEDLNTGDPVPEARLREINEQYGEIFLKDLIEFSLYDNRVPIEQLISDIKYFVQQKGCKIVMLDNLNFFMDVTKANDAIFEMDRVTHELIILCKQIDVHIVMVMHPKKTDGARVENEFDIKGSSTAVQEAHNIFLLNRPTPESLKDGTRHPMDRELKISKMRRRGKYAGYTLTFKCRGSTYFEGLQI